MAISPDVVEYVRTLVRDDHEANDQIEVRFGDGKWGEAVASFMSAVFFYAMDLRFQGKCDDRSILAFVAELRSQNPEFEMDPKVAERVIAATLDDGLELAVTPEALGAIQTLAAYKALSEANLSDAELDALLHDAARLAVG
ncbi:hypothetical protein GCM10027280_22370 [Micromonospora polyrhachis]|uniref:Uncharacterized protein n=1 Tax=Micromonospora polyrhachis TaxID=1282883 RepID=A0A7W7SV56_9ACTN|nr:hypothetical protein [Micromonospora polyrhachis]MBB4961552.1 hypothetical protein [Micromonospora polyrhachis]